MRKVLICEQSKEFHNAAALGLFNSAVGKSKGDENLSGWMYGQVMNTIDAFNKMSSEEKKIAKQKLIENYTDRVNAQYRFGDNPQESEYVRAAILVAKKLKINLPKVSKPLSNIELSVQSEGQKLYDKFNIRKVTQKQIQDQIHKLASNIRDYEDALKNRKNLTEEQRMSWKTDLNRNKERKDFWYKVFNAKRYST